MWLTDVEVLAALFSSMIHDYEHTGTTNTFHINTGYKELTHFGLIDNKYY